MNHFCIFMDESGMSNPKMYKHSPYFSLCGMVTNKDSRDKIKTEFEKLKLKHFGKNLVLHSSEMKKLLKSQEKIINFAIDLEKFFKKFNFFLLYVVVNNEKANRYSWNNKTTYKKVYRIIVGNLVKFLIAKNAIGNIYSEASNVFQDICLYESFFHYIANGIYSLSITPSDVKKHLTAVNFVTKNNNDVEEQISDLFGYMGRVKIEVDKGLRKEEDLDPIDKVLLKIMNHYLFKGNSATKPAKIALYKSINSLIVIP